MIGFFGLPATKGKRTSFSLENNKTRIEIDLGGVGFGAAWIGGRIKLLELL